MRRGAIISKCGNHRYALWRLWDDRKPTLLYVILNPSKADANTDDNTVKKCIKIAAHNGYGGIRIVNLFSFRTPSPKELKRYAKEHGVYDLIDNHTYEHYKYQKFWSRDVCFAWGTNGTLFDRDTDVKEFFEEYSALCIEKTKNGHPKHPLFCLDNSQLKAFNPVTQKIK